MTKINPFLPVVLFLIFSLTTNAQDKSIRWLSFEQLEDSLATKPKKVFIDFYADWCSYCKKIDQTAFRDPEVVSLLNQKYYAVKMNAESNDTIIFDGQKFVNRSYGKKRNATHDIPLLLASRKNSPFSLPAIIVLDASFRVIDRYFEYISPKKMITILNSNSNTFAN
ncbi:thioredoxin family protein [Aquimarina sp. RZ0]|uniref:thioredoxin family protein n=1 Tax=Aquimarina sp. RZ0 TaxID=2607730 RepID=UPI0011F3D2E5|nr:thioredoxin family protein [Aquimarina sp. RZ0]KAA1244722.1 thioredoxin fold domain-containing protein [Aquimarina sp. RZ0]